MTVAASTFSGNTATDGGAIDNTDHSGGSNGFVWLTASTLIGSSAADGGLIDQNVNAGDVVPGHRPARLCQRGRPM